MSLSALAKRMADAGAPIEAIIMAMEAVEAEQARIQEGRDKAAERKRRQRDKGRDVDVTVTGQSRDADVTGPLLSPQTPLTTPVNNKPARVKGHRLPNDWQPKSLTGDAGTAVRSWPSGALDRELARFRDWAASATGPNALKTDWDAAWRNWIRKAEDDGRYGSRQASRPPANDGGSFLASLGSGP